MSPLIIALSPEQTVRGRHGAKPSTYISSVLTHTFFTLERLCNHDAAHNSRFQSTVTLSSCQQFAPPPPCSDT